MLTEAELPSYKSRLVEAKFPRAGGKTPTPWRVQKGDSMAVRGPIDARWVVTALVLAVFTQFSPLLHARQQPATTSDATTGTSPAPRLSIEQQEEFLKKAKILRTRGAGKGVTNTIRATLSDGTT